MARFSNVSSTSIDPGFSYADYAAQVVDIGAALLGAVWLASTTAPETVDVGPGTASASWVDGTTLVADLVSGSGAGLIADHAKLETAGAWAEIEGSVTITSGVGGVLGIGEATATRLAFGNGLAVEFWTGNVQIDLATADVSGQLTTMTLAWNVDDPLTAGIEWKYVTLEGDVTLAGGVLSGVVTGLEWGEAIGDGVDDFSPVFTPEETMSGLSLDAGELFATVGAIGFDALPADSRYAGNDVITGTSADDRLDASSGNDKVFALAGDDVVHGGAGNDHLFGGAGMDLLSGGAGNDRLHGDAGNDRINGGTGVDHLFGGAGGDTFVFDTLSDRGHDTIADFDRHDGFALDVSVFNSLENGVAAGNLVFGSRALDADDYLIFNARNGKLYYDADADGAGAAELIAVVKGATGSLDHTDFSTFG